MTHIADLVPDADALITLEPEELGLKILPSLVAWVGGWNQQMHGHVQLATYLDVVQQGYNGRADVRLPVAEAWAWLEGQGLLITIESITGPTPLRRLSRRAVKLAESIRVGRPIIANRLTKDMLHPVIREDVWALFHRGKYDTAVFEAMKAVEVAVRDAAGFAHSDIGVKLMRAAFNPDSGPLTDSGAEYAEREALSALFAGAIGSYKNPHSHRNVALDDPDETAEIILLANHLLRIVDGRRLVLGARALTADIQAESDRLLRG